MKILLSVSLATRAVLVALVIGFALGAVAGYRAAESVGQSRGPGDVRAASVPDTSVHYGPRCC